MQRIPRLVGLVIAGLLAAPHPAAPPVAARPTQAATMTVHLKVSGDLHYTLSLTHAEDGSYTIPSAYSCVRFTHPNFAPRGKPLAYGLSFDNPDVLSARRGIFFSFYYNPTKLASQHVDGAGESVLLAVPAQNVGFGPGGLGTYTVVAHLSPDMHSGSLKATNFRNLLGAGHVTIEATWSCSTVFVRST